MTIVQDLASKWQNAYNSGGAAKIAHLYVPDAVFSSGILGTLKGRSEIEAALADQIKKAPKITINPAAGHPERELSSTPMTSSCFLMDRADNMGLWISTTAIRGISRCMFQT